MKSSPGEEMRSKQLVVGLALAVLAAACGSESQVVERNYGVLSQGDAGARQILAYNYEPDSSVLYGFTMDMRMDASMDFPGLGGSGDMSMGMSMGGDIEYDIAAGSQPGSVALTMRSSLGDFDLDHFTVDGQSVAQHLSSADLAELSNQNALPEITVLVSDSGEILEVSYGDTAIPTDFLSGFGTGGFSDPTGMSLAGMFGPEMPSEGVGVGAEWTVDNSQDVPLLGNLAVSTHYWITDQLEFNGRNVLVIVSSSTIEDVEIDLLTMLEDMMDMDAGSLAGMGMDLSDLAAAQSQMLDGMEMRMRFSYDKIEGTTYFDPAEGAVVWAATDVLMTGAMDMNTPDGDGTMTFNLLMDMQMLLAGDGVGT